MIWRWFIHLIFILTLLTGVATAADETAVQLRNLSQSSFLGPERLHNSRSLEKFYRQRHFQPAWSAGHQLLPTAEELLVSIPDAAGEGLDLRDYHFFTLTDLALRFSRAPTPQLAAELDLLLSDAFFSLASHYRSGRISPALVDDDWHIPREGGDLLRTLDQVLTSGRIRDTLRSLLPKDPAYVSLRRAWQDLRLLASVGGWPQLKLTLPLRPGTHGAEVEALRSRLVVSGDLAADRKQGEDFDPVVEEAVRRFQARHGLSIDGIVGRQTLTALNIPAAARARQLSVNLERWRWLPRTFGPRHLRVNLPAFHLEVVEDGESVLEMRVIVGRQLRQSPAFVGRMTYLVLNPYWEVPRNLAIADLLPKIQADRSYLAENGIKVFTAPGGSQLNPAAIDWQELGRGNFPYHLRQDPGPKNSLGRIKFIFPNAYNVYLHDTPSRKLFAREERSFSSGCIRIEKPIELAQYLLRGTQLAASAAIDEALQRSVNKSVTLPAPLPVYLLYLTAWVDSDGTLNFRPDLYDRDARLAAALH